MRIGLVGPAGDAGAAFAAGLRLLLRDRSIRHVLYLGDDADADAVMESLGAGILDEDALLARGVELAVAGTASELDALLREDREARRPAALRRLPKPPARALEMLERYIVLAVHDKAALDEDDVANAHIFVYGKSEAASIKRIGPRMFLTPGPVSAGHVGVLTVHPDGRCEADLLDLEGNVVASEWLELPGGKVVVSA